MKFYHNKRLRHTLKRDGTRIVTCLQYKRGWSWKIAWGYNDIHFAIRDDPEYSGKKDDEPEMIRTNPLVRRFHMSSGWLEEWDESTFDLKRRLREIAEEYSNEQKRLDRQIELADNQLKITH